jgi:hypothetical protein
MTMASTIATPNPTGRSSQSSAFVICDEWGGSGRRSCHSDAQSSLVLNLEFPCSEPQLRDGLAK